MAEIFKFFNSAPGDERKYQADDFADYFGSVLSTGLLHTDNQPGMEASVGNGMKTVVSAGKAIMQGYAYENTSNLTLDHNLSDTSLDRIDRVVLRLDKRNENRHIKLFISTGTAASSPSAPSLQRDEFIYELSLAQIRVKANTSALDADGLTDERLDEKLCGLVYSLISIPTSQFQDEWDSWFNTNTSSFEQQFHDWFSREKGNWGQWFSGTKNEWDSWFADQKSQSDASQADLDSHITHDVSSAGGVHGMRVNSNTGAFEYNDGNVWNIVSGGLHVGNTENLSIEQKPGTTLELKWSDPADLTTKDEGGQVVTLAKWAGTQLRRKAGSYPVNEKDGDLVVDSTKRNQHSSTAYADGSLTAGTTYYYMLFPYTTDGVFTIDPSNRIKETAVDKLDQSAPNKPSVSSIEFDRATVKGDSGSKVSLDKSTWYDSPHTFTGLTEETSYSAYAKFPETKTHFESPVSSGSSFTTPSEAPGPGDIVNGDKQAGFFGEVPASNLFTGSELASAVGITQGTLHNDNAAWIKYTINGKTCFRPLKSIRYGISYDEIERNGCVDGSTTVQKNGMKFKVRLMRGATQDPASDSGDKDAPGSEWNQIMLPISEKAIDDSWEYPDYVGSDVPVWKHGFGNGTDGMYTDDDLGFVSGDGYQHWCQEHSQNGSSDRVNRGNSSGPSIAFWSSSDSTSSLLGWAPTLELIE